MELRRKAALDKIEEHLLRLAAKARKCRRCHLHRSRTHVIFGESPADAAAMLYITSAVTCRPSGKK
jgi:uracil-DNA glycosylase